MPETHNPATKDASAETAETKVRRALKANPGTTTANLAKTAGVGRSTASKLLSRWVREGLVTRTAGEDQSVPVTWAMHVEKNDSGVEVAETSDGAVTAPMQKAEATPIGSDEGGTASSVVPDPSLDADAAPESQEVPKVEAPNKDRLPKGALYELVKDFLYAHPGEEFGPAKIGSELGRSSGAVNNALEKLTINGLATKTCEAPKRFTSS